MYSFLFILVLVSRAITCLQEILRKKFMVITNYHVTYEGLMAEQMKMAAFWVVVPCSLA
jgi:hypothetical protein